MLAGLFLFLLPKSACRAGPYRGKPLWSIWSEGEDQLRIPHKDSITNLTNLIIDEILCIRSYSMSENIHYTDEQQADFSLNWLHDGTPPPKDAGEVRGNVLVFGGSESRKPYMPLVVTEFTDGVQIEKVVKTIDEAIHVPEPQRPAQPRRGLVTVFTAAFNR